MYSEDDKTILNRMKKGVPSDIDTSEGSFIHDALSPVSQEIAKQEINLDEILKRAFAITAAENGYSTELDNRCAEQGVIRKSGTSSTGQVTFTGSENTVVPEGTVVETLGGLQYETTEAAVINGGFASVNIASTLVGDKYNVPASTIVQLPVQVMGITKVTNANPTSGGTDVEDDESFLKRYLAKVQNPASSGNVSDYVEWAESVNGVGGAKVFPLWNGNGTVKVCIVDSNKEPASETLVAAVQNYIEGVRPIGAAVTYKAAEALNIDVSAKVVLSSGYTLQSVKDNFSASLNAYIKAIAFTNSYISNAKVGDILLNTAGVLDYSGLTLNGSTSNVGFKDEEIPVLGTISLGV
ncbi:baseplate J/gp47 family protein [Clostridium neuense]|uniref:Baseplate J/gp47 family protein n=1 Tax=Clostridium neuense TaxID=1728934 RepID=A0ABW8TB37_9CLOT